MNEKLAPTGLYRKVRDVAEDRFDAQPGREKEAIVELLQDFARRSGQLHDEALSWFQHTHAALYNLCKEVDPVLMSKGVAQPELLAPAAERIAKHVDNRRTGSLWHEVGLSPLYEDFSKQIYSEPGLQYLQRTPAGVRFVLPADGWREVIEGSEGRYVADDLIELLKTLGVDNPDVDGEGFALISRRSNVHIPPKDAALIMDMMLLRPRGALLHPDAGWHPVQRATIPGVGPDQNAFLMPTESYLGMRGVAKAVEELTAAKPGTPREQLILEAVNKRLEERGVEQLTPALVSVEGQRCIILSTEQARVLLKPADASEVSLARYRLEYDPKVKDFDPAISNLAMQSQELSYKSAAEVTSFAKAWGLEHAELLDIPATDAQMMVGYDVDRNAIICAARGTESFSDIRADINASMEDARHLFGLGRVPEGFLKQFESLLPKFNEKFEEYQKKLAEHRQLGGLPPEPPSIILAGHSLGGTLAAMLFLHLGYRGIPVRHVYTCGQAHTFAKELAEHAAQLAKANQTVFVRYVNGSDPVPHVPPNASNAPLGFRIYFDQFARVCPQNKPLPADAIAPDDDIMSRLKRTLKNIQDFGNDHRLKTYFVVVEKAVMQDGFTCSVWD